MKKIWNAIRLILIKLGYINDPVAYIENSMREIEKIQHPSISFIDITIKIHGNCTVIKDGADFYGSNTAHRYLIYNITLKNKDRIFIKIKFKDNKIDISYDKIMTTSSSKLYRVSSGMAKFGGTIDIYDEYANRRLIKYLVRTLYKTNLYINKKSFENKK